MAGLPGEGYMAVIGQLISGGLQLLGLRNKPDMQKAQLAQKAKDADDNINKKINERDPSIGKDL